MKIIDGITKTETKMLKLKGRNSAKNIWNVTSEW